MHNASSFEAAATRRPISAPAALGLGVLALVEGGVGVNELVSGRWVAGVAGLIGSAIFGFLAEREVHGRLFHSTATESTQ